MRANFVVLSERHFTLTICIESVAIYCVQIGCVHVVTVHGLTQFDMTSFCTTIAKFGLCLLEMLYIAAAAKCASVVFDSV